MFSHLGSISRTNLGQIREFFRNTGYTEARMKRDGLVKIPWHTPVARTLLLSKISSEPALLLLVRLFFFGEPCSRDEIAAHFPPGLTTSMVECGMLTQNDKEFMPECLLTEWEDLLLASDSVRYGRTPDLVLGITMTTEVLARCLIHKEQASVLDLGTGCGPLGLFLARSVRDVTSTDINNRSLEFARFNAALNGLDNITFCHSNLFGALEGRKFDLIVCNPPFFLTSDSRLLFCDNPVELDGLAEGLAKQAPAFLKPGGFFQMLCEWVELEDQSGMTRLQGWFQRSNCDVLVSKAYEIKPVDYILRRATESVALYGEASPEALQAHMDYFQRRGVRKIFGGLITIRLRDGANWFVIDEMDEAPSAPIGADLWERFQAQDVLTSEDDLDLLTLKVKLPANVVLVQESTPSGRGWVIKKIYLERRAALPRRLAFDSETAAFITKLDGSQTLNDAVSAFAKQRKRPRPQTVDVCLRLVKKLASLGLVTFEA